VSEDLLSAPGPEAGAVVKDNRLTSHWEELAGWAPGRPLHACYLTVADQPELRAAVADYQAHLGHLPGLDLILPEWLHMTIQGASFIDEVHPESIVELAWRLDDLLQTVEPFEVTVDRPIASIDSVSMPVRPIERLAAVRDDIRRLLAQLPAYGNPFVLPGQDGDFDPHISIAYANAEVSSQAVSDAIDSCPTGPVTITVRHVSMITLLRSDQRYHWIDERSIFFAS
jgi:hypothetical protein